MLFNLPIAVTWFRIVAIPLVVIVFYLPVPWARPAAGLLFVVAGITDWLDGYLARRLGQTSSFGAFLDPVADKLIVSTALVLLVQARAADVAGYPHFDLHLGGDPTIALALVAAVIIGREITVSALREWMSQIGARAHVAVNFFGKWKTTFQIVGISLMLYRDRMPGFGAYLVGEVLLYVAAALTLWSMIEYLRAAGPAMRRAEDASARR
ncbi:MAG TPA: CDP-alcohol phosphatidyltransferase family protein [Gammaproteobacteria bacterium]|jgi:phosphatidylglycerophosphate synthase|nr:CDP-alcohol phosphatidyltransferase family protein [Gammaproteobacteria bacterium]